jgi:hypothetical protein
MNAIATPPVQSIDVKSLAAELSPALAKMLADKRADILALAPGRLIRWALGLALGAAGGWLPIVLELGIGLFAWKFEGFTVGQIVDALLNIRSQKPECGEALRTQQHLASMFGASA